jgi:hypothetical protein
VVEKSAQMGYDFWLFRGSDKKPALEDATLKAILEKAKQVSGSEKEEAAYNHKRLAFLIMLPTGDAYDVRKNAAPTWRGL